MQIFVDWMFLGLIIINHHGIAFIRFAFIGISSNYKRAYCKRVRR